ADRGVLADQPDLGPQERLAQLRGLRDRERGAGQPPVHGRLPGLAVRPGVVDRLAPGGEQPVQLRQVRDGRPVADLDQELLAGSPEETLDLPPPLRLPGQSRLILWITRGRAGALLPGFAAGAFGAADGFLVAAGRGGGRIGAGAPPRAPAGGT